MGHAMVDCFRLEKESSMSVYRHTPVCLLIFYTVFYMTASVCTGALRVEVFDWKIPFDHTIVPSFESTEYLVALLSLEISFLISGLLFVPVVRIRVWDYAATVTFVHMCMCCIVTGKFPLMWQWWVEIGSGFLLMLSFGMTLAYFATKRQPREFPVDV